MNQTRRAILAAIAILTIVVCVLVPVLSADALNWRRWLAGRFQPETYQYLALPSPTLSAAVVDAYIRGAKSGGTTLASVTLNMSTAAGYLFPTRLSTDLRWVSFISGVTVAFSASGQTATFGGTITAGTVETYAETLTNGNMETGDPPTGWIPNAATLSAVADERTGGSGSKSLNIAFSGASAVRAYQASSLPAGALGRLSLWGRSVDGTNVNLQPRWSTIGYLPGVTTQTGWTYIAHTRTEPNGNPTFQLYAGVASGSSNARVDDCSLVQFLTPDATAFSASTLVNTGINPNAGTFTVAIVRP